MSNYERIQIRQAIRAAEGYLDLIQVFAGKWPPKEKTRNSLAQRALDALADLPKKRGHDAQIQYLRGEALRSMEMYSEAVQPLREAARSEHRKLNVMLALGWCYKRLGQLDDAIEALEEALCDYPDEGLLHYNLACYWSLASEPCLAIQYLSQAFELDPAYRDLVASETDFDPIREDPGFQALTAIIV